MGLMLLWLLSHHYWIHPEPFHSSPGETVVCRIAGGHHFPEGDFPLDPKMVRLFRVIAPDGSEDTLSVGASPEVRWVPPSEGCYQLVVELGPRRLPRPRYVLFALVAVGGAQEFAFPLRFGETSESVLWWLLIGHGVVARSLPQAWVFEIRYDTGLPMAYAYVEILDPEGRLFGETEADSLGRVLFVPPGPGVWTLRVSDGMGHGTVIRVEAGGERKGGAGAVSPYRKAVCGAALIWGLAGTLFYLLGRRRNARS